MLSLLREFVPASGAAQLDAVFRSATAKAIEVNAAGVNVDLALTLPDSVRQAGLPGTVPDRIRYCENCSDFRRSCRTKNRWSLFRKSPCYVVKEEKTGRVDNIARATYAVYNAGPGSVSRYCKKSSSRREKKVDIRFWEITGDLKQMARSIFFAARLDYWSHKSTNRGIFRRI